MFGKSRISKEAQSVKAIHIDVGFLVIHSYDVLILDLLTNYCGRIIYPHEATDALTGGNMITQWPTERLNSCHPFDKMMADVFGCACDESAPKVEVTESSTELQITAQLRGLNRQDVHIELTGQFLTIRAKKSGSTLNDAYSLDHLCSSLHRTFPIDFPVASKGFSATFQNGCLRVSIPKATAANAIRIPVQMN